MECYWKTILLLLAVLIQSLAGSTTPSSPSSAVTSSPGSTAKSSPSSTATTELTSTLSQTTSDPTTLDTAGTSSTTEISTSTNITASPVAADTTPEKVTVSNSTNSVPSASSKTTNTNSTNNTVETSTSSIEKTSPLAATTISTSSSPLTTTNTPASALTTTNTPASALTATTNTPSPPLTTSNSPSPTITANNSPSTTAATPGETTPATPGETTPATPGETTPAPPSLGILISETNLLLTDDSSKYFVEIQVSDVHIDSIWLVIQNASTNGREGLLLNQYINISSIDGDLYVYKNDTFSDKLMGVDSVLIALYAEDMSEGILTTKGLHDFLLYSSSGNISVGFKELFANIFSQNLIIDYKKLNISEPLSLSRCSENVIANSAALLTVQSPNQSNVCNFKDSSSLEMKLTTKNQPCTPNLPTDFKSALKNCVISDVNDEKQCGLTAYMMNVTEVVCTTDRKELDVKFTVSSVFPFQGSLIMDGYKNFLRQNQLEIKGEHYYLTDCYRDCFAGTTPPTSTDDNRIRVTVAVVVSCIGVFLLVLLFVVLYLRRKRKGILQFHMTRLDEDDDLVGDMDDFVGNQGATFRNYR